MKDTNNIDKVLKQNFQNFAPNPPAGIWDNIQSNLPNGINTTPQGKAMQHVNTFGKIITKVKSLSVVAKIVAITAVATATVTAVYLINQKNNIHANNTAAEATKENTAALVQKEPNDFAIQTQKIANKIKPQLKKHVEKFNKPATNPIAETDFTQQNVTTPELSSKHELNMPGLAEPKTIAKDITQKNEQQINKLPEAVADNNLPFVDGEINNGNTEKINITPQIPNVFTPNNDGYNDFFDIEIHNCKSYTLVVTDLNNIIVYESHQIDQKWDGKHFKSGQDCAEGTYLYTLQYKYQESEKEIVKNGMVKLKR